MSEVLSLEAVGACGCGWRGYGHLRGEHTECGTSLWPRRYCISFGWIQWSWLGWTAMAVIRVRRGLSRRVPDPFGNRAVMRLWVWAG